MSPMVARGPDGATVSAGRLAVRAPAGLKDTSGPSILGLEFAGSADRLEEIFVEWGAHGRDLARLSLWIDFPFMAVYGAFFALASLATRDFARAHDRRALAAAGGSAAAFAIAYVLWGLVAPLRR